MFKNLAFICFLLITGKTGFCQRVETDINGNVHIYDSTRYVSSIDSTYSGLYCLKTDETRRTGIKEPGRDDHYFVGANNMIILKNIEAVYQQLDVITQKPMIDITFNRKGADEFAAFTRKNRMQRAGLIIKGKLIFVAMIYEEIANGKVRISGGNLTEKEVVDLANQIKLLNKAP